MKYDEVNFWGRFLVVVCLLTFFLGVIIIGHQFGDPTVDALLHLLGL